MLLNAGAGVAYAGTETVTFSEACEKDTLGLSLLVEFSAKPLQGSALIRLNAGTVGNLVEMFFGGQSTDAVPAETDSFTPGETSVATLFGREVVEIIADTWQPIQKMAPEFVATHLDSGVIESVAPGDKVICSEFTLACGDQQQVFHVLWPLQTISALVPALEGQKRERDAAEDAHWSESLRSSVTDSIVRISSRVGHTRATLGAIANLRPGDVIGIGNPKRGTVYARNVPILRGRFGVHDGRYAMEAVDWLTPGAPRTALQCS